MSAAETDLRWSLPAIWNGLVALTVYRVLLLRWLQRWLVWTLLLFELSRLELSPNGMHPDRAGGLGVLTQPSRGVAVVILGLGAVVAATLGTRMRAGAEFTALAAPIATYVVAGVAVALVPMLPFVFTLARARRRTLYGLGEFARAYVDAFGAKWLPGRGEEALGSSDIQSLNDLAGAFDVAQEMRVFPFSGRFVAEMVAMALLPILPLYLASLSVDQLASALLGIVF